MQLPTQNASFKSRLFASFVDMSILDLMAIGLAWMVCQKSISEDFLFAPEASLKKAFYWYLGFRAGFSLLYHTLLSRRKLHSQPVYGITFGKAAFKICPVLNSGTPLNLQQSFVRFFSYGIDAALLGLGYFLNAFNQYPMSSPIYWILMVLMCGASGSIVLIPMFHPKALFIHDLFLKMHCVSTKETQKAI
jgi:uncharacterized RDD family membrane protein YckC